MTLGKKKQLASKSSSNAILCDGGFGLALGLEFFESKRRVVRKNVLFSSEKIQDSDKICKETLRKNSELESLHEDILVNIICGVDHEDLKNLFHVSKTIREAILRAKKQHFEYTTPRKTLFFRGGIDSIIDPGDEIEAPLLKKYRPSRIIRDEKVSKIAVTLFK